MRDGVERSERREQKRSKRWPVHGRSLQHVLNAIRRRAHEGEHGPREDGAPRRGNEKPR